MNALETIFELTPNLTELQEHILGQCSDHARKSLQALFAQPDNHVPEVLQEELLESSTKQVQMASILITHLGYQAAIYKLEKNSQESQKHTAQRAMSNMNNNTEDYIAFQPTLDTTKTLKNTLNGILKCPRLTTAERDTYRNMVKYCVSLQDTISYMDELNQSNKMAAKNSSPVASASQSKPKPTTKTSKPLRL